MPDTFKPTIRQRARLLVTQPKLAFVALVPSITYYGGATVTRAHDATGALFTVCCCKANDTGKFGLYVLNGTTPILIAPVSGRGSVWVSLFDGSASWVGFDGSVPPQGGPIPGFVPFVSLVALQQQLAALQQQLAGSPPTISNGVFTIGPQGPSAPLEGGEIRMADGLGGWNVIDCRAGNLRLFVGGKQVASWTG